MKTTFYRETIMTLSPSAMDQMYKFLQSSLRIGYERQDDLDADCHSAVEKLAEALYLVRAIQARIEKEEKND